MRPGVRRQSLELLHTTQLNVGDDQKPDSKQCDSHDVLPQIPVCPVCNTLLCQVVRPCYPVSNTRQQQSSDNCALPVMVI